MKLLQDRIFGEELEIYVADIWQTNEMPETTNESHKTLSRDGIVFNSSPCILTSIYSLTGRRFHYLFINHASFNALKLSTR